MIELTQEQERVRQILISIAQKGDRPVTYSELLKIANIDLDMSNPYHRNLLGKVLGAISTYEHENGRPMLSSVVVSKDTFMPSNGFYKLADEFGYGEWRRLKDNMWGINEMNRAFEFWKNY